MSLYRMHATMVSSGTGVVCDCEQRMNPNATIQWLSWAFGTFLIACGNDGGSETGGSATDGGTDGGGDDADDGSGDGPPPSQSPDEDGDQCGDSVLGWQTMCVVESVVATTSDKGDLPGITPAGEHTNRSLCCEGHPTVQTANGGCEAICQLELCEAAKLDHMNRCISCGPFDCGFDMSDCLAGGAHDQLVTCASPVQLPFSYTLTASCSALNNEDRNPDGSFGFLEQPDNDLETDPPVCMPTAGSDLDPPAGLGQYAGSASAGTVARVTWSLSDTGGQEQSEDLDVHFEYGLVPCTEPTGECLELTSLVLTLPTIEALGMTISKARLEVVSVAQAPILERGQAFEFDDGTIGVLMQAHVDGVPLLLSGHNAGVTRGLLSPAGDQFSISSLRFEFQDSIVTAALEIEIQGQYDARRPNAQITHLGAPSSCDAPMSLLATSWDYDDDPLSHQWWVRDVGTFSGPQLELVVPAGDYDITLTSTEPSGLFDTTTLRYARKCQ